MNVYHSKNFTRFNSVNCHNKVRRLILLLLPFYRWAKWDRERLNLQSGRLSHLELLTTTYDHPVIRMSALQLEEKNMKILIYFLNALCTFGNNQGKARMHILSKGKRNLIKVGFFSSFKIIFSLDCNSNQISFRPLKGKLDINFCIWMPFPS